MTKIAKVAGIAINLSGVDYIVPVLIPDLMGLF